jgi:hypothetical protein
MTESTVRDFEVPYLALPERDRLDLDDLAADFPDMEIIKTRMGWRAVPRPNPSDVLTAVSPEALREKLERHARRKADQP